MKVNLRKKYDQICYLPPTRRATIRRKLLNWYDRHGADLPWRRHQNDPYAQWVAEIMLQQTRVDTVIHYYDRFLKKFPTYPSLARARHETVLKCWEGLGYYRRILHLHRAVQQLHQEGLDIPDTFETLKKLPGVGEYTAGAIASIAFNRRVAAVDSNVARVLARLMGIRQDVQSKTGRLQINEYANQLVPLKRPGDFNQAWMDLGRTICTPRLPKCSNCPLKSVCVSDHQGIAHSLPIRNGRHGKTIPLITIVVGIFLDQDRMLIHRRPTGGMWSGLWEFPNMECKRKSGDIRQVGNLADGEGVVLQGLPEKISVIRHQLTHRSLRFHLYVCRVKKSKHRSMRSHRKWVTDKMFQRLSVSTAHRKIMSAVKNGHHI